MQEYAEKEGLMFQPQRMIISKFELTNGTIITPLLPLLLELQFACTNIYRFVKYTPVKFFDDFLQSPVNNRRKASLCCSKLS